MILIILLDYEGLGLVQVENVILFILILIGGHILDSKLGHLQSFFMFKNTFSRIPQNTDFGMK